jgi:quercetin dioxygenase-like cupin family protein
MNIEQCRVNFEAIEWTSPLPNLRFRAFVNEGKRLRLAEFSKGFVEPDWCLRGHIGFVLEGTMELAFTNGKIVLNKGDGIFLPPGEEFKHKGTVLTDVVRVVLVEVV